MRFFNSEPIQSLINENGEIAWSNEPRSLNLSNNPSQNNIKLRQIYFISSKPAITSGMIKTPKAVVSDIGSNNAGQWVVNLDMTKKGRKKWSKFTGANINRQVLAQQPRLNHHTNRCVCQSEKC